MGFALDAIVGGGASDVEKRVAGGRENFLAGRGEEILKSDAFATAQNLRLDSIRGLATGRVGARRRAVGQSAADVGTGTAAVGRGRGAFDRAQTRARALTRLVGATGRDFDAQLQRDRLGAVGAGLRRQGIGQGTKAAALGIRDTVLDASRAAQQAGKDVIKGAAGAAAGAFGAGAANFARSSGEAREAKAAGEDVSFLNRIFSGTV